MVQEDERAAAEPQVRGEFQSELEHRAQRLVESTRRLPEEDVLGGVGQQVALTLGQIERLRELHTQERRGLLRMECYVDTELMQMEQRTPPYSPHRFPEREKLQRRLIRIEDERRRLSLSEEKEVRQLHDQLLSLLLKHEQLAPTDDGG